MLLNFASYRGTIAPVKGHTSSSVGSKPFSLVAGIGATNESGMPKWNLRLVLSLA
jgi:hypothetical protein